MLIVLHQSNVIGFHALRSLRYHLETEHLDELSRFTDSTDLQSYVAFSVNTCIYNFLPHE